MKSSGGINIQPIEAAVNALKLPSRLASLPTQFSNPSTPSPDRHHRRSALPRRVVFGEVNAGIIQIF